MRIGIESASAAVRRTLADIVTASGHEPAEEDVSLILEDTLHPGKASHADVLRLKLVASASSEQEIPCPISPARLAQQIAAKLASVKHPTIRLAGGWELDGTARQLRHRGQVPVTLTEKECLLLAALSHAFPAAAKREALLKDIWAYDTAVETHTLETHIYRLRGKFEGLKPRPCDIVTLDGSYRLTKDEV